MLRFYAERWHAIQINVLHLAASLNLVRDKGQDNEYILGAIARGMELLETEARNFPFSETVLQQISRFCKDVKDTQVGLSFTDVLVMQARGAELSLNIQTELAAQLFLLVRSERREFYEQVPEGLFGSLVASVFGDANKDISAAGRCYAVEEWTACVFHCMRVLEYGLRMMAVRFNVPFHTDSWHTVLQGIEKEITSLRNKTGLTDRDRLEITYYSEAATQFRHFKDAWRNHVSHARVSYDENEARTVLVHVREFMQHLATRP